MLGHDLEMTCIKFHENRLIIDGEIDEKHALQIIASTKHAERFFGLNPLKTKHNEKVTAFN